MIETVRIQFRPEEFADCAHIKTRLQKIVSGKINDWHIKRKSIDARQKQVWIDAEFLVATGEDSRVQQEAPKIEFAGIAEDAPSVVIVGAGPAGLFAAYKAIELGWKPIVVERGKKVEDRIHDVVKLQKEGILDEDSNFCFGEGGAGAFSDGKLFTRSKKRGNVEEVLNILHQYGAKKEILFESHPHIGSDRLPKIIRAIREKIIEKGGEFHFSTSFESLILEDGKAVGIRTKAGDIFKGPVILASGHSARDVYKNLQKDGIKLECKGFAMGVRLEHPQETIDRIIYHSPKGRGPYLPPAEYRLKTQVDGRGVYSFCMCPGGVIVPSASAKGESVVNGMSASGRSGRWANSGIVVEIRPEDFPEYDKYDALGLMKFQEDIERRFFDESRGINSPAQRMGDFVNGKESLDLPATSYVPGIHSANLEKLLPGHIADRLRKGFIIFGKKNPGFLTNDAVMIGLESRTSSPVRIPRDPTTLEHTEIHQLFPVGEGAGYAGGIVSAAMDGIKAMQTLDSMRNKEIKEKK